LSEQKMQSAGIAAGFVEFRWLSCKSFDTADGPVVDCATFQSDLVEIVRARRNALQPRETG